MPVPADPGRSAAARKGADDPAKRSTRAWLNAPQLEKSTDAWAAFSRSAPSRFGVTRGQFSKKFPILAATTYRAFANGPEPLEGKSPSQDMPERGCISRETAGLLRNSAQNRA